MDRAISPLPPPRQSSAEAGSGRRTLARRAAVLLIEALHVAAALGAGMAIRIPAHCLWPPPGSSVSTDDTTLAAMRHGLEGKMSVYQDTVLGFIYAFLPKPPVSTAPILSCDAAEEDEGIDRISGLPDDLLRRILVRLPAKDVARTAVLSTRWRGLWLSTPLRLVDTHFLPRGGVEGRPPRPGAVTRAVRRAVSAALRAHPGPFPFASLSCQFIKAVDADRAVLARWFRFLATKGVEELAFVNRPSPYEDLRLPAALFSCASLRRLYLGAWRFVDTATLPRGARLISNSLRCAQFCLALVEEVAIVDCQSLERCFIWRCPTQRYRVKIGHAPQLSILGYLEPGVHVLEIGNTVIKPGTKPSPKTTVPSVQMLALHLHFGVHDEVKMLPSFLKCFPNVETLCIQSEQTKEPTSNLSLKFWHEAGPIKCVQSRLKTLAFHDFHGDENEFAFLMFVAENAQVLENMNIVMEFRTPSKPEELAKKMMTLDNAKWASGSKKVRYRFSRLGEGGGNAWSVRLAFDFNCNDPFLCL